MAKRYEIFIDFSAPWLQTESGHLHEIGKLDDPSPILFQRLAQRKPVFTPDEVTAWGAALQVGAANQQGITGREGETSNVLLEVPAKVRYEMHDADRQRANHNPGNGSLRRPFPSSVEQQRHDHVIL